MRISDWSSDVCSSDLIAVADALKDIAARLWQLAWQQRRKLEVWAIDQIVNLYRPAEVDRAIDAVDLFFRQLEILEQGAQDRARAVLGDLQPHRAEIGRAHV